MGRVAENVVAELLVEEADRRRPPSDAQFRCRNMWPAVTMVALMVDRAVSARREVHKPSVLLLDFMSAFRSIGSGRLIHTMRGTGMDGDLILLTGRFLTDETVKMVIDGNVMERQPVEPGIPQISPASPNLITIITSRIR